LAAVRREVWSAMSDPTPKGGAPVTDQPDRPARSGSRGSRAEAGRIADVLRKELSGALLVAGSVVALIWASSPWSDRYQALLASVVGPSALHLNLPLAAWAADGLLAVFFLRRRAGA
jgi:Na+:H+ antiporter, NhaA family